MVPTEGSSTIVNGHHFKVIRVWRGNVPLNGYAYVKVTFPSGDVTREYVYHQDCEYKFQQRIEAIARGATMNMNRGGR